MNTSKVLFTVGLLVISMIGSARAVTVNAADLDYGISGTNSNSFALDFSGESIWTAGAQRSENGSVDPNNRRAGRVFVDFQLDAAIIAAAGEAGATASFTFDVISIGAGVAGTPYTDGLDLRLLGTSATDRSAATLWNTVAVGGADQADILGTGGAAGSHTVTLTNPSVLTLIAGASAGDYLSFGLSNSTGVSADPVGNSTAETYGFQMNTEPGTYVLSVVPESVPGDPVVDVESDIFLDVSRSVRNFDISIVNLGGSDLTISGVSFSGTNGAAFSVVTLPGAIGSLTSGMITIQFDPTGLIGDLPVAVSATMDIASNDPNTPATVNLTAEVPAPPSEFYAISAVSSNVTNFYAVENLIHGVGAGFDADAPHDQLVGDPDVTLWVTNANGSDFFNNVPIPAPVLVFDLGQDRLLSEISVWGYSDSNSNGMSDFSLRFATDADGSGGFGLTETYNPLFTVPFGMTERNHFEFDAPLSARYVELTPLDNYFGAGLAAGGDRVGLGEVAFEVTPPLEPRFKILDITRAAGGAVTLTFESIPGRIYEVHRAPNLTDWMPLNTVIGTDASMSTLYEDANPPTLDQIYYRIEDTGQDD